MTTFTVWKFDDPEGAAHAASVVKDAESEGMVKVVDHAVMTWPLGADKPETHHKQDGAKRGAAWGAFWGRGLATEGARASVADGVAGLGPRASSA